MSSDNQTMSDKQYEKLLKEADNLIYYKTGPYSTEDLKAYEILDQLIAAKPKKADAYLTKANGLASLRKVNRVPFLQQNVTDSQAQEAFDNFLKAIELEPFNVYSLEKLGSLFLGRKKDYSQGELSKTSLLFDDSRIARLCSVVDIYLQHEREDEEGTDLTKVYDELFTLVSRAVLLYKNEQLLQRQIKLIEKLEKDKGENSLKYKLERSLAYEDLGSTEKAAETREEILKLSPNFANQVVDYLLEDGVNLNKYMSASTGITTLTKVLRLAPNTAYAYYALGRILDLHYPNELKKKIELYQAATSLQMSEHSSWIGLCHFYLSRQLCALYKFDEALQHIKQAQDFEPGCPKIRLEKARLLKSVGQVTEAYRDFEVAQRLNSIAIENVDNKQIDLSGLILAEKEELLRCFGKQIMEEQAAQYKKININ